MIWRTFLMLEITEVIDNPDGSAAMTVNMSEDVMHMLLEYAINDILRKKLNDFTNDENDELDIEDDDFIVMSDLEREEDIEMERYVGP